MSIHALSIRALLAMPAPEWAIGGILPENGLGIIYGGPGQFKTFVALDMALSVAAGVPWQGHEVRRGHVVYISAEGGAGLGKRVAAWLSARGIEEARYDSVLASFIVSAIRVHPEAGDLDEVLAATIRSPEWQELLLSLDEDEDAPAPFIIVDTLARCFEGDENQQEDMGAFVRALDYLREDVGATVLVLHHMNADGARERGNTSLRGAADTMMQVSRKDGEDTITIKCTKQKDYEDFEPIRLDIQPVESCDSVVLELSEKKMTPGNVSYELVRAYLAQHPHATVRQIAEGVGLKKTYVGDILKRLRNAENEPEGADSDGQGTGQG